MSIVIVILAIFVYIIGTGQSPGSLLNSLFNLFQPAPVSTPKNETSVVQSIYEKLSDDDLIILNVRWGKGNCSKFKGYTLMNCRDDSFPRYPNGTCLIRTGYAVAYVSCGNNNTYCEVYANEERSDFLPNGLQKCENEIFIAEKNYEKSFYTQLELDKNITICCSYMNNSNTKILKNYEVCKSTELKAFCIP